MRIIAGKNRGRKLVDCSVLKSLRPTTDRNRESLFNILSHSKKLKAIGFKLEDANLLDVFCGSGAVSFEALSRGAKSAILIDNNPDHLAIAKKNATLFKMENVQFLQIDALKITPFTKKKYNLIFIDPPYNKNLASPALNSLIAASLLQDKALIIIESSKGEVIELNEDKFMLLDKRQYGITIFSFYIQNLNRT